MSELAVLYVLYAIGRCGCPNKTPAAGRARNDGLLGPGLVPLISWPVAAGNVWDEGWAMWELGEMGVVAGGSHFRARALLEKGPEGERQGSERCLLLWWEQWW